MSKIFCKKYQTELDALNIAPVPGEKGQYIKDNYSAKAWSDWLDLQTMLINENQLDLSNKENRKWLNDQMEKYLNNSYYQKPSGYIPQ